MRVSTGGALMLSTGSVSWRGTFVERPLICHACRRWLHGHEFHRDRTRPERGGRHVHCKPCRRELRATYPSHSHEARKAEWARECLRRRLRATYRYRAWSWFVGLRGGLGMGIPEGERS